MNRAQTHMSPAGLVPKEWLLKRLDSLADISYGISDPLDRSLIKGTKILAMPNITRDGRINLEDVPYVSDERIKNKHLLKYGDLLFNWRNGSKNHLGKTALFNLDGIYTHVGFLLRIRPNKINSRYLHAYLNFIREKGFFLKAKIQVNNTFNKEELSEVPVVFPSREEQGAIASIFDL